MGHWHPWWSLQWRAWPADWGPDPDSLTWLTADTRWWGLPEPYWLNVWPARRSLHAVVDPGLVRLPYSPIHSSTSPYLTAPQGYSSWQLPSLCSHLPESSFCWSWSVLRVCSSYPHSIPGRWLISTLADLCVLTFWLCQIPGSVSYLRWRIWQFNSAYIHRNI